MRAENAVNTRSPAYRDAWGGPAIDLQYSAVRTRSLMSLKSIPGSTPWVKRLRPKVTRSTLPVRSPLPNRVPSMRSAPAMTPSSAAATPVPRSLWGWSER